MNPNFTKMLNLQICETKIDIQKIDSLKLDTFGMVIASFLIKDMEKRSRFLVKTFLLVVISIDIALRMSFLILNNIKINFVGRHIY